MELARRLRSKGCTGYKPITEIWFVEICEDARQPFLSIQLIRAIAGLRQFIENVLVKARSVFGDLLPKPKRMRMPSALA